MKATLEVAMLATVPRDRILSHEGTVVERSGYGRAVDGDAPHSAGSDVLAGATERPHVPAPRGGKTLERGPGWAL